jgi:SPASM domain peptide maturase of grasp-with-spasm system
MIDPAKYFRLFACCLPVKGAAQAIICDTQRSEYRIIPNDLYDILTAHNGSTATALVQQYGEENRDTIMEYLEILYEEEFIFFCDSAAEVSMFPAINMDWEYPALVSNALIDVDESSRHDFATIVTQLEATNCANVEVRLFSTREAAFIESLFEAMELSIIEHVTLITPPIPGYELPQYKALFSRYQRLVTMLVHSCSNTHWQSTALDNLAPIIFTAQEITSAACCGFIHPQYFNATQDFFVEAQQHNSCLNRKISIDVAGNIKNCPAMTQSWGNIQDTSLLNILQEAGFTQYWHINKDKIAICRDCEFRYICHDCRAFVQEPGNLFSKPLRCSYDPYTARWKEDAIQAEMEKQEV